MLVAFAGCLTVLDVCVLQGCFRQYNSSHVTILALPQSTRGFKIYATDRLLDKIFSSKQTLVELTLMFHITSVSRVATHTGSEYNIFKQFSVISRAKRPFIYIYI